MSEIPLFHYLKWREYIMDIYEGQKVYQFKFYLHSTIYSQAIEA